MSLPSNIARFFFFFEMISFLENVYPSTKTWMTIIYLLFIGGPGTKWTDCPWSKAHHASRLQENLHSHFCFMPQKSKKMCSQEQKPAGVSNWRCFPFSSGTSIFSLCMLPGEEEPVPAEQLPHTEQGKNTSVFITGSIIFSLIVMGSVILKPVSTLQTSRISGLRGPHFGNC